MNILLLNPPGDKPYIRDYYCSKVSKSNYLFPPIDLIMLSGILSEKHHLSVCDAIADQLGNQQCLDLIIAGKHDVIISLVGAASLDSDLQFLRQASHHVTMTVVSGDALLENPSQWLDSYPFLSAVLLDFTSTDIVEFLAGNRSGIRSIVFPGSSGTAERPRGEEFSIPVPRHELFSSANYRFPFVHSKNFTTVLTDYGCPYRCSFCVMASLGYRYRGVENVVAELRALHRLGKKELFIIDQSFGVKRERALELCWRMSSEGFGFGWVCFSRVDLIDKDLLHAMKRAGCHTIIFGVESASSAILQQYHKGYSTQDIIETFALCRREGIRTVATFILGLPEETRETATETIAFLKHIQCDYISVNVAVPRAATELRATAIREGLISEHLTTMDQSGETITMASRHLSMEELRALRRKALSSFYLRPSYLLRRILSLKSWYEFKEQTIEGLHLLIRK